MLLIVDDINDVIIIIIYIYISYIISCNTATKSSIVRPHDWPALLSILHTLWYHYLYYYYYYIALQISLSLLERITQFKTRRTKQN